MPNPYITPIRDLEDAKQALGRVEMKIDAVSVDRLSPYNLDVILGSSVALGAWPAIQTFRDPASKLVDFDIAEFDSIPDYAKALWYLQVVNLPPTPAPREMEQEVTSLRAKLLLWATTLATAGYFNPAALDKIKEGAGLLDATGDVVALQALYWSSWDTVKGKCDVTEEDLDRAAKIGPAVFNSLSVREGQALPPQEAALKIRKAWTKLDRAYQQARRAIAFFRHEEGDVDTIAPNLRRSTGRRTSSSDDKTDAPQAPGATPAPTPTAAAPTTPTGPVVGSGAGPFVNR